MWSYLKSEKVVSENIAENMPRRVVQKCVPKYIKPENVQVLIDKSEETNTTNRHSKVRTELAIKMLVSTGLRLSELVNVRHSDIDGTELIVNKGKGNKQRTLPLHPDLLELIKEYTKVKKIYGYKSSSYLFMSKNNKQITELVMYRDIKAMLTSIGREDLSPHKLRATFANILASNEVPLQLIQDFLGHSNFNTTKIYLDLTKKKQDAVNGIDFFGKKNVESEEEHEIIRIN
jgi:site-specific recombinase XerD